MKRLPYRPELDGLRTVAVLLVVAFHSGVPLAVNGRVGVDVFFVLSGYLITQILTGRPELTDFYLRRLRRLMPALLLMVAATGLLATSFTKPYWWNALVSVIYLGDLAFPLTVAKGPLLHTWSLALEMQFYLLWPFVLRLPKPRLVLTAAWLTLTIVRTIALRDAPPDSFLFLTPLRASGMILGGLLALVRVPTKGWMTYLGLVLVAVAAASDKSVVASLIIAEVGAAMTIASLETPTLARACLGAPSTAYLGRLSYSLYLWHYPLIVFLRPAPWPLIFILGLGGGITFAAMSYHGIEKPLRLGHAVERSRPMGANT
ncbi:MAG: acyltransferase family protein [Ignavibacteriales bacterium]